MPSTVKALKREAKENAEKMVRIYNPNIRDFTVPFHGKKHTIHSLEIEPFPYSVAEHIKKHLATEVLNERGGVKSGSNHEDTMKAIYKEIEVI